MAEIETHFVKPPDEILQALLEAALGTGSGSGSGAGGVEWVEHGSNTLAALVGDVAVRIGRQPAAAAELRRTQALVDALPELPFHVPRSIGDDAEVDGYLAIAVERVPGSTSSPEQPDPGVLLELLEAIHGVALDPLREHLAVPRAFCGGDRWEEVLREGVIPLLPPDVRAGAVRRIDELAALDVPERVLNHGDLGASNIHWQDDRIVGVLDWDLAAADDPAEDVAGVAASFGIWDALPAAFDDDTIRRARVFQRSFPLQVVGFAVLQDRPAAEVGRVARRAARALRAERAG